MIASQWEGGLKATIEPDGQSLDWANGTVWTRSLGAVLKTMGRVDTYGIHFDVDKAEVRPDSKTTLQQIALLLRGDPGLKLTVAGHTDNSGAKAHNLLLSQRRAAAVVAALVKAYAIDPHRLKSMGYGDTRPVAPNADAEGRAANRRVELKRI